MAKSWLQLHRSMSTINSAIRGFFSGRNNLIGRMRRVSLDILIYLIWKERGYLIILALFYLLFVADSRFSSTWFCIFMNRFSFRVVVFVCWGCQCFFYCWWWLFSDGVAVLVKCCLSILNSFYFGILSWPPILNSWKKNKLRIWFWDGKGKNCQFFFFLPWIENWWPPPILSLCFALPPIFSMNWELVATIVWPCHLSINW